MPTCGNQSPKSPEGLPTPDRSEPTFPAGSPLTATRHRMSLDIPFQPIIAATPNDNGTRNSFRSGVDGVRSHRNSHSIRFARRTQNRPSRPDTQRSGCVPNIGLFQSTHSFNRQNTAILRITRLRIRRSLYSDFVTCPCLFRRGSSKEQSCNRGVGGQSGGFGCRCPSPNPVELLSRL